MNKGPRTYSIIGLGKLGASMAAAIAKRGFNIIGVDVAERSVTLMNAGHAPVSETGLEETIATNANRIRATLSHREAFLNSSVSFVIVPTPSNEHGAFSLQYAAWALRKIGLALAEKEEYHLIVLTSTVLPGATRHGLLPILEQTSGKRCGKDFGLCYSPEFIALGSVIRDFLNPDFTLVGEFDKRSGDTLEECYSEILENHAPCKRMSIENAELTKISVNSFVTAKITFANMLVQICEGIPGGDIDVVTDALGCDRRIGGEYLRGALGYGGPCFPRDNLALSFIARALGTTMPMAETTNLFNRDLPKRILERLRPMIPRGSTVAVLGLSYKPYSHVIEESQSIYIAKALANDGNRVLCYDPLAGEAAKTELAYQALVLDTLGGCLDQADVVLVTTADPAFKHLKSDDFTRRPVTVIDFWRLLDGVFGEEENIHYVPIGRCINNIVNAQRLDELWGITPMKI